MDEGSVEVAHEALVREWPRLREWLNENREGLRLHRRIGQAAQEWDRLDRDPSALYRGLRLAQAVEWAERHSSELNPLELAFLDASQVRAEQVAQERETQQQRELEAAQRLAEAESQTCRRANPHGPAPAQARCHSGYCPDPRLGAGHRRRGIWPAGARQSPGRQRQGTGAGRPKQPGHRPGAQHPVGARVSQRPGPPSGNRSHSTCRIPYTRLYSPRARDWPGRRVATTSFTLALTRKVAGRWWSPAIGRTAR